MQENFNVQAFFTGILSDPEALRNGHAILRKKMQDDQCFIQVCIEYLCQQQKKTQPAFHFEMITVLHPPLIEQFPGLKASIQEEIRGGLLNAVVALHEDLKTVAALGMLIRELIQIDMLEPWLESFGELLKWVVSDQISVMEAGIEFFIYLLKETPYNSSNNQLPLHKVAPGLLENLFQIFAHSELSERVREKLLYLVLQLIKTFSLYDGVDDQIVKQCFDGTYEIWMSLFLSAIQGTLHCHVNIKKYIMKIIVVICRDMQKYLACKWNGQFSRIYTVWVFCYRVMPIYLWNSVWEQPFADYPIDSTANMIQPSSFGLYFDDDPDALLEPIQALALSALQFLSVMISLPNLSLAMKLSIHSLTNVLFHYMMLPEFEARTWQSDSQHFIPNSGSSDYEVTVRTKVIGILNELIEKAGDYAIQAILFASQKFLINLPSQHTTETILSILNSMVDLDKLAEITNNIIADRQKMKHLIELSGCDVRKKLEISGQTWRKIQVALTVLGRFSEDIIVFQSKQQASFDIEAFIKGIIKQINNEEFYVLLKGQSLHCMTRFTEIISIKYKGLFPELLISSIRCLKVPQLPVQMIAVRAITIFLRKLQKHGIQLGENQLEEIVKDKPVEMIMQIELASEVVNSVLEALIELCRNKQIKLIIGKLTPEYLLGIFHQNAAHTLTMQLFFNLLRECCMDAVFYSLAVSVFSAFIQECLKAYQNIITSNQKKHLKAIDTDLILMVLKTANILIEAPAEHKSKGIPETQSILSLLRPMTEIVHSNQDTQIQVYLTICLKNMVKVCSAEIKQSEELIDRLVEAIRGLLKIPADKSFEGASVYAGNLAILAGEKIFKKKNYDILQEAVLKVFRSRTPSVIQSLVLIYSRMMNAGTTRENMFEESTMGSNLKEIIDFLSSFSIENRMGLKILTDKWLLQQSLFRGKYTKISTFMALSKLFLLRDKRVDNLLVIGFNPSHTNINNDVTAPLKILATLIRCLDNQMGKDNNEEDSEDFPSKEESNTLDVGLEKFRDEKTEQEKQTEAQSGGLADRENQQGSTCYMSAMLEFYDDGEECDETTEDDLLFLQDSSTKFELGEYLLDFFRHLQAHHKDYFRECLKGIMKEDLRSLQKYIKLT